VIVFDGRRKEYLGAEPFEDCGLDALCSGDPGYPGWDTGEANGQWDSGENFSDWDGNETWTEGTYNEWYLDTDIEDNLDVRGIHYYDEEKVKLLFDVFVYDFGKDGRPGDNAWIDEEGNGILMKAIMEMRV
jgi:hypothetical protein